MNQHDDVDGVATQQRSVPSFTYQPSSVAFEIGIIGIEKLTFLALSVIDK